MSLFDECISSDSENDADYVPEYSSDEEPLPRSLLKIDTIKSSKRNDELFAKGTEITCSAKKDELDEKKKADDLFKNFLMDCKEEMKKQVDRESGIGSCGSSTASPSEISSTVSDSPLKSVMEKGEEVCRARDGKKDIEVYEFAGEAVRVISKNDGTKCAVVDEAKKTDSEKVAPKRKGLASVLGVIQSKKRLSVLDKSVIDWQTFKKKEDIEHDLKKHNLGKQGFLERKRFLQRSDLRSFEIERDMRLSRNKK